MGISPGPIAAGPDGALWFIASNASTTMIDRMTTAGNLTNQFSVPVGFTSPWRLGVLVGTGITAGPDGALWFLRPNVSMGRLSTQGTFTQYPLPAAGDTCCFSGPVAGPDGALWFDDNGWTGRITTSGTVNTRIERSKSGRAVSDHIRLRRRLLGELDTECWTDFRPTLSASPPQAHAVPIR